jgi:hypothetical protein
VIGTVEEALRKLNWRLTLIVFVLTVTLCEGIWISSAWDLVSFAYILLFCPLVLLLFLFVAIVLASRRMWIPLLSWSAAIAAFILVSLSFIHWGNQIRAESRWLLYRRDLKSRVLALPPTPMATFAMSNGMPGVGPVWKRQRTWYTIPMIHSPASPRRRATGLSEASLLMWRMFKDWQLSGIR